jgi:ClpP class serine protease
MSPQEYLSKLITTPLAMDKMRARTLVRALASRILQSARPATDRPEEDIFGQALPTMQIIGDVAYIPVTGVLDIDVPDWCKQIGLDITDVNDIEAEIQTALADANVRILAFPSNSPGGCGLAAEKLFDTIEAATRKKPTLGYVADGAWACSGMYWGLAACTAIYSGYYAGAIGNIGAYMVVLDDSEFWKLQGFDWIVLRDGEYKGIGEDKPSDDQLAYLQGTVTECATLFRRNVATYRSAISAGDMRGQWYKGTDAAKRGFVGANTKDLNAAVAKFRRLTAAAA